MVQEPSDIECFTVSGYKGSTMSHQIAPLQVAIPPTYGSITFTHWEEDCSMVKIP
jgi:hypothetical protein